LKKMFFGLVVFLVLFMLTGCGRTQERLFIFIWSDYIKMDLVRQFEREYNVRVIMDFYDSNETMYARLRAGSGGFDIVVPTCYMVQIMIHQGMLRELDHSRIPNLVNIDPKFHPFTLDPEMRFSVPYMVGSTGIGYLASVVGEDFVPSWGVFGDSRFAGRMTMLDDMRETIGAALKYLGFSMNSIDPREHELAGDLLIEWRRNLARFDAEQYRRGLVSREFFISHGYSGDVLQAMAESDDVRFAIPIEGTTIAVDNFVMPVTARNVDLAYSFINFMLRPEVAAANMEYVFFLAPNIPAYELVSEELRNNPAVFLTKETLLNSEILLDLGENNIMFTRTWDRVLGER